MEVHKTGAVAEWIKTVAFEAIKLNNQEVGGSIPGRVKERCLFIQEQCMVSHLTGLSKEAKFELNCTVG